MKKKNEVEYKIPIIRNPLIDTKFEWVKIKGIPITFKGISQVVFFLYDASQIHESFGYRVCEKLSGRMISEGKTKLQAINLARNKIIKELAQDEEAILKAIEKAKIEFGLAPE